MENQKAKKVIHVRNPVGSRNETLMDVIYRGEMVGISPSNKLIHLRVAFRVCVVRAGEPGPPLSLVSKINPFLLTEKFANPKAREAKLLLNFVFADISH